MFIKFNDFKKDNYFYLVEKEKNISILIIIIIIILK